MPDESIYRPYSTDDKKNKGKQDIRQSFLQVHESPWAKQTEDMGTIIPSSLGDLDWRLRYPGNTPRIIMKGNVDLAGRYKGEARKLLYQLKNNMIFQRLGQLKMTRIFDDGTVITASSHFGMDVVVIDVTRSTGAEGKCVITLINFPEKVQPMRYPGEIRVGEVEGVDYIKTYYTCSACEGSTTWELTFAFETPPVDEHYDEEPNNHCVVSIDGGCWGEIITIGSDQDGTYAIWKAYTESLYYIRGGHGFMKVHPVVKNTNNSCEVEAVVEVDCCNKDISIRPVTIYWDKNCSPDGFCVAPATAQEAYLYDDIIFYAAPDLTGSCPPYIWELTGAGTLETFPADPLNRYAIWRHDDDVVCDIGMSLRLTDRCGQKDEFAILSCCQDVDYLAPVMGYTSLVMGCSEEQELSVTYGCPPYEWSIVSGGGSIEVVDDTHAKYTSPDENENCENNPLIRVKDCCLNDDEIQIAVNCYDGPEVALLWTGLTKLCCYKIQNPACAGRFYDSFSNIAVKKWDCASALIQDCVNTVSGRCPPPPPCTNYCPCDASDDPGCWNDYDCNVGVGPCQTSVPGVVPCDTYMDVRTAAMKEDGCCPLNPATGLPY